MASLDYDRFTALVHHANKHSDDAVEVLTAALELVRGRPFSETRIDYWWTSYRVQAVEHAEAAHKLVQLHLERREPDRVIWATSRELEAEPYFEALYRD